MKVTKQHFELVARILHAAYPIEATDITKAVIEDTRRGIVYDFANAFAEENPRFDRDRFLRACGIEE